ncbi:hypothetical protein AGR1A_pAt20372 [Agrobacterium fabacearum CFBP 5771]|nr:hypothetical protein AGR1A_pAt20372 [Agrobacterium fabacearum CFBP 5771]
MRSQSWAKHCKSRSASFTGGRWTSCRRLMRREKPSTPDDQMTVSAVFSWENALIEPNQDGDQVSSGLPRRFKVPD